MNRVSTSATVVFVVLFALAAGAGCSSKYFRQAMSVAGEEAAYVAVRSALLKTGVKSADHIVDAVRLVADRKDYGGALAAFTQALEEHNVQSADKLSSREVLSALRRAESPVRRASGRVADALAGFCSYAEAQN